ncbi:hypothetical protein BS78_10G250200 [Paspalum vaginatum]|nr:hypothetical protein BS78_10G250200 [Paspalum vaginatum]KAJ1260665.1 hypothetical protein BS78_10G250200 [Paspalum vaginatum]
MDDHSIGPSRLAGPPHSTTMTDGPALPELHSRCNPERVSRIFSYFGGQKSALVRRIGFEGLLKIPSHLELDDSLSLWLLNNLDTSTMTLCLNSGVSLPIRDVDVHLVLGIPFQGKPVHYDENQSSETVIALRHSLSLDDQPANLTLSWLEHILEKEYSTIMSSDEERAFKVAVVLHSMAYYLAPHEPHPNFPLALSTNVLDTIGPGDYNCAGYILTTLKESAKSVQSQFKASKKSIVMYGCILFLQVFFLDNMNFGPSTPFHMDLPRVNSFKAPLLKKLTENDPKNATARDPSDVCYSRGWRHHLSLDSSGEEFYDNHYLNTTDLLQAGIDLFRQIATNVRDLSGQSLTSIQEVIRTRIEPLERMSSQLQETVNRLCETAADDIKRTNLVLYPEHIPPAEDHSSRKRKRDDTPTPNWSPQKASNANKFLSSVLTCQGIQRIMSYYTTLSKSSDSLRPNIIHETSIVGGCNKKVVTSHSDFPPSPFQLGFSHPALCRLQKIIPYKWMMDPDRSAAELELPWIHIKAPRRIVISGVEVRGCLMQTGIFSVSLVDAIMLLWTHLDDRMYSEYEKFGLKYKRWRHFLPATFAVSARDGKDFLGSHIIRQFFLGDHLTYNVEDCQMFVVPALYQGRWSCYFWDFKFKTITVLDPMLMKVDPMKSSIRHEDFVADLHNALFACKDKFFCGWDVASTGWSTFYLTNFPPKSKFSNTGLYSVHYARSFTGDLLAYELKDPTESNLSEIRGEIMYFLFSMGGNIGYKPQDLFLAMRQSWRQ